MEFDVRGCHRNQTELCLERKLYSNPVDPSLDPSWLSIHRFIDASIGFIESSMLTAGWLAVIIDSSMLAAGWWLAAG